MSSEQWLVEHSHSVVVVSLGVLIKNRLFLLLGDVHLLLDPVEETDLERGLDLSVAFELGVDVLGDIAPVSAQFDGVVHELDGNGGAFVTAGVPTVLAAGGGGRFDAICLPVVDFLVVMVTVIGLLAVLFAAIVVVVMVLVVVGVISALVVTVVAGLVAVVVGVFVLASFHAVCLVIELCRLLYNSILI